MNSIEAVSRVTYVDALASRNETTLYISFINRNFANDMDVEIDLSDFKTDSKYKQHIFTTNDMITNELGYFEDKSEKVKNHKPLIVHLPKHSLSIFEIKIF
jgi:alpha-L-arabinofuranosidase